MRKLIFLFTLVFSLIIYKSQAQINSTTTAYPFGSGKYSYGGGNYGIMPTNLPATGAYGQSTDAANAYKAWKTSFTTNCGGGQTRVNYDTPAETVSEGIGYGMLLAAYAGDKTLFDGLWAYYKANSNVRGLMNWHINGCSGTLGGNGATDADEDAAWALIIATHQWPTITSPYNYVTEATNLITAIQNYEIASSGQPVNGDGWGLSSTCRNPSYFAPAYYREFGRFLPSQATFWNNAVTACYTLLNANADATTGLVSNWSDPAGVANQCPGSNPLGYGYDACRNPWRMAVDVLWNGPTIAATSSSICTKIAAFTNGKATTMKGPIAQNAASATAGSNHNAVFTSMYSCGVMGSNSAYQSHMNSCYTETKTVEPNAIYYGATLRVISLFLMSGNFWRPAYYVTATEEAVNNSKAITLWPNPSKSEFNLDVSSIPSLNEIRIIDAMGTVVWEQKYTGAQQVININAALSKGIYCVAISGDNKNYSTKVVIE